MVMQFFIAFSDNKTIESKIEALSLEEFTKLSEQIAEIINQKKKN